MTNKNLITLMKLEEATKLRTVTLCPNHKKNATIIVLVFVFFFNLKLSKSRLEVLKYCWKRKKRIKRKKEGK